jgi:hypothetical protein
VKTTPPNGGRPKGSRPLNRRSLITLFNFEVEPYAREVLQRNVALALEGDREALLGVMELIGWAMLLADGPPKMPAAA